VISLFAALFVNVTRKRYASSTSGKTSEILIFNAVCALVATIVFLIWGGAPSVSTYNLILGILFGLISGSHYIVNLQALKLGPLSYTQLFTSFSSIIPTLSGLFFFNEKIVFIQYVGIALSLVSLVLAVEKKGEEKKSSLKWLTYCLMIFLLNGLIGVMQKVHQSSQYASELNAFLIIAFLVSFLFSSTLTLILSRKENPLTFIKEKDKKSKFLLILSIIVCGALIAVNNKLNLYLAGVIDSAVLFPILNGGGVALATIASLLVFKEKLSLKQWIGIAIGAVAIILLCNPF
jgi:drug/metabolite transporter (DMT)-like permease